MVGNRKKAATDAADQTLQEIMENLDLPRKKQLTIYNCHVVLGYQVTIR